MPLPITFRRTPGSQGEGRRRVHPPNSLPLSLYVSDLPLETTPLGTGAPKQLLLPIKSTNTSFLLFFFNLIFFWPHHAASGSLSSPARNRTRMPCTGSPES